MHATRLRGGTPEEQLLAISDVFHDWFQEHEDYDGCSFQPAPYVPTLRGVDYVALAADVGPARASDAGEDGRLLLHPSAPAHPTS